MSQGHTGTSEQAKPAHQLNIPCTINQNTNTAINSIVTSTKIRRVLTTFISSRTSRSCLSASAAWSHGEIVPSAISSLTGFLVKVLLITNERSPSCSYRKPGASGASWFTLRIGRAGLPTATWYAGIDLVTTEEAPITQPSPIVMPGLD